MLAKLLPILLALVGLGAGVGAGVMLKPEPEPALANPCGDVGADGATVAAADAHGADPHADTDHAEDPTSTNDFIKINNQFVVPVVNDARVSALVVMSLSLEMTPGNNESFYQREPKLRDAFLQVLFDHANAGGFDGVFTDGSKLDQLRAALLEVARRIMGPPVVDVLVTDIVRQDN